MEFVGAILPDSAAIYASISGVGCCRVENMLCSARPAKMITRRPLFSLHFSPIVKQLIRDEDLRLQSKHVHYTIFLKCFSFQADRGHLGHYSDYVNQRILDAKLNNLAVQDSGVYICSYASEAKLFDFYLYCSKK